MLKVLLKLEGHEARIAFDGPAAIAAAKPSEPDVVLLDLTLPGMSGIEVADGASPRSRASGMPSSSPSPATARKACRPRRLSTTISRSPWILPRCSTTFPRSRPGGHRHPGRRWLLPETAM